MVKSIPDGNISVVFYFSLFISLYKQLQSALNMYMKCKYVKCTLLKRKGLDPETGERKFKNIFVFFFQNVQLKFQFAIYFTLFLIIYLCSMKAMSVYH